MITVKIHKTFHGSVDGRTVRRFAAGEVHTIPHGEGSLAETMLREGWAKEHVEVSEPQGQTPAAQEDAVSDEPETKADDAPEAETKAVKTPRYKAVKPASDKAA